MLEIYLEIGFTSEKSGISPLDFLNSLKEWLKKQKEEGKIEAYLLAEGSEMEGYSKILHKEGIVS